MRLLKGRIVLTTGRLSKNCLAAPDHGMKANTGPAGSDKPSIVALPSRITAVNAVTAAESAEATITPAIGPLPAIYLPRPGQASGIGLLWRAAARCVCRVGSRATRHSAAEGARNGR